MKRFQRLLTLLGSATWLAAALPTLMLKGGELKVEGSASPQLPNFPLSTSPTIVINEIMYHPLHQPADGPENVAAEYLELFNRGTNDVNLAGWRLSKGVDFTFPNVTLPAGGYLAVAANLAAFNAAYPGVPGVVGGWTGTLANNGEQIQLDNALGGQEDQVTYASQGDWAIRQRGPNDVGYFGWEWYAAPDGLGRTLELMNPWQANDTGQNWAASAGGGGTPGAANSVLNTNLAPLILDVTHAPIVPRSSDPVLISARVDDELTNGVTVTLFHRVDNATPAPYSTTNLFDDGAHNDGLPGDRVYGVTLPARADHTVIEYYVQATDAAANTRTWPAAARQDNNPNGTTFAQTANCLYQVDDYVDPGGQPFYRIIMTEVERAELDTIGSSAAQSNAEMNGTLASLDGTGLEVRHRCGFRNRGNGSRTSRPNNIRVAFPNDRPWQSVRAMNLNTVSVHSQVAAAALFQKAGLIMADSRPVLVRVNGNPAGGGAPVHGSYAHNENLSSEFAARHLPLDPDANVYRCSRTLSVPNPAPGDLAWRSPGVKSVYTNSYVKESNASEDNWNDLIELTSVLSQTNDANFLAAVHRVIDVDNWLLYFALNTIGDNNETSLANSVGDDYAFYIGKTDPRCRLMGYDVDSMFGNQGSSATASLFRMTGLATINRFIQHPEILPRYYGTLRRLLETTLSPAQAATALDRATAGFQQTTALINAVTAMKTYITNRANYALPLIPTNFTITTTLTQSNGYYRATGPTAPVGGQANIIATRTVLINGTPATYTPMTGRWTNNAVALKPGVNRLLVQSLGTNGVEVARGTIDIWYDDGSTETLLDHYENHTTLTAAGGPYLAITHLYVDPGVTLTIEPGATLLFNPGVRMIVQGRLIAEGTPTNRIRFTRTPGGGGNWPGIVFDNTANDNRLTHADIEFADSGTNNLYLLNSELLVDNVTWSGTTRTIIELNNSSLLVRHSVFPALTAGEHIRGGPLPAGGVVRIEGNTFGTTAGGNDVIDFFGAARPGPVLQVLDNTFTGASDDVLELNGADAHIEGNAFLRVRKNNAVPGDSANAIALGRGLVSGTNYSPSVVAVRNLFLDVDHVALVKEGANLTLTHNTTLGIAIAALNFSEPELNTLPGASAALDGNVFWNPAGFSGTNFQNRLPTNGTVQLSVNRSILAATDGLPAGTGNLNADPLLANVTVANITPVSIRDDFALRPGSPAIGAGPGGRDMGALVAGGATISGEPLSPTPRASATLTVGGAGLVAYQYRVNGGAYSGEVPLAAPILLSGLADGSYTVYVLGKNTAGEWQDVAAPTASRSWTVDGAASGLVINEVLARNNGAVAVGGDYPDLIELHNGGSAIIVLAGMGLSDDLNDKFKYIFPPGTAIEPGDHLVLYGDSGPGLYVGFALGASGDGVYLHASGGALVDAVVFGPQVANLSVGRLAGGAWGLCVPTFGAANVAKTTGDPRSLKINEWLADGAGLQPDDFVELWNPDPAPVSLGGLYLSDAPEEAPDLHQIAPLSFVAGAGAVAFLADGDTAAGGEHLNFKLSSDQGRIGLFDADLSLIDCVFYGPQYTGSSEGRRPSGGATFSYFSPPTPGAGNPGAAGTITTTNITIPLLPLAATWRYQDLGSNLLTAWKDVGYSDSSWSNGAALLGFETVPAVYPEPFRTTLRTNNESGSQIITYYLRTYFNHTTDLTGFTLIASAYLDDGAVFYLNGAEFWRVRVTGNPPPFDMSASNQGAEGTLESTTVSPSFLVPGTNVLAVELHQGGIPSSDAAFGLALSASRTVTNSTAVSVVFNEMLASSLNLENPDGSVSDWVELFNPSASSVDLADMSLSDAVGTPRRWVFPAGVSLPAGGYLVVRCDPNAPASTNSAPPLNTGFGLDGGSGDDVWLFDKVSQASALLDSVAFGVQAPDFSLGRIPNGSGPWGLTLPNQGLANIAAALGSENGLRLNEWMPVPRSGGDWFELHNTGPLPVALGGLFLTDNMNNRTKSPLPALSFISSFTNGFVKFIADSAPEDGANHADFALNNTAELIALHGGPAGNPVLIDRIDYTAPAEGVAEGRLPDGGTNKVRFPNSESPGESNYLPLENVILNEALSHTDPPLEDAIELRNQSDAAVNVGGWFLSDSNDDLRKYRIPPGTVIAAGGFLVIYEYEFNPFPGFFPNFALNGAHGDQLYLTAADALGNFTGRRDIVKFGAAANGVSFGRLLTSDGVDFTALIGRTFGVDNPATTNEFRLGTGLPNTGPRVGPVVVSEVHYHPPDLGTNDNTGDEFIELLNLTAGAVSLFDTNHTTNSWRLRDAVDFDFPPGTVLPAGGYALVVGFAPTNLAALAAFTNKYGLPPGVMIFGPWSGKLDNSSDSVELCQPDAPQLPPASDAGFVPAVLVDKVKYSDSSPWASAADGTTNGPGVSLQRRIVADYGNDPVNWLAGVPTPGGATGAAVTNLPVIVSQPASTNKAEGGTVTFSVGATGAAPLRFQWRFNGMKIPNATNSFLTLANLQASQAGGYTVLISNPAGAVNSQVATLGFQSPPVITQEPASQVVLAGGTANFSVGASGSAPLRYQWRKNTASVSGATNSAFSLPNAQSGDQADYTVVITNNFGSVTSAVASLTINSPPAISAPPQDQTVTQGSPASFAVTATGSAPLRFQWRFNGANLAGQTNGSLNLSNVQTNQAGNYTVVITNAVGSVTSAVARLFVIPLPIITIAATDASAGETGPDPGTFTVTRSFATNSPLAVTLAVSGTAANGTDYTAIASPVTIPANQASAIITVTPDDDVALEATETVILTVGAGAGYLVGAASNATVNLADNDNLAPSVTLTNPPEATLLVFTPTNVVLSASASDPDGTVAKVEYFRQGTNKIGEAASAPYNVTWSNAPAGTNVLTAVATDNFGGKGTSAPVTVFVNFPPAVSITSPAGGATFTAPADITINASATDNDGTVTQVVFFAGTTLVGTDAASPFTTAWSGVAVGGYNLTARATDDRGITRTSVVVSVTVNSVTAGFTDIFADRQTLGGFTNFVTGNNATATKETGEPNHGSNQGGRSLWVAWTAPANGTCAIDTFNSSFDTTLGVYLGSAVDGLTSVAQNNDTEGSLQSRVTFNATAGTTYNIAVDGRRRFGVTATGDIQLHLNLPNPNMPPTITAQPQNRTVPVGSNATFTVTATGTGPLFYRWRFNGVNIAGATSSSLTVASAQWTNQGNYSVQVSNAFGATLSANAVLTVDDGLVTTETVNLIPINGVWRYDASGADNGTAWKEVNFPAESGWPSGPALFGFDDSVPDPYAAFRPFGTDFPSPLTITPYVITYYFRAHFNFTNDPAGVSLVASNFVDDGAVYWLNGAEAGRLRVPAAPAVINATTPGTNALDGETNVVTLLAASLVTGDNVLAVEVHQGSTTSTDVSFALALNATITVTNQPVIVSSAMLPNGDFELTLSGFAGRVYAIDRSTNLLNWINVATFTNVAGQTPIIDVNPNGSPRFYRGRLVP